MVNWSRYGNNVYSQAVLWKHDHVKFEPKLNEDFWQNDMEIIHTNDWNKVLEVVKTAGRVINGELPF